MNKPGFDLEGKNALICGATGGLGAAWALRAAYCTSKAAVDHLSRELAREWAPYNITVNTAPTFAETNLVVDMFKDPAFKQYVLESIPLGCMAKRPPMPRLIWPATWRP